MTIHNPILDFTDLPRWQEIAPIHVSEAITQVLNHAQTTLRQVEGLSESDLTWENTMIALNNATEKLSRAWGVVAHCHHVIDSPEWREAYNNHLEEITAFWTSLGQSEHLFAHFQSFAREPRWSGLTPVRQHIITTALRDFKLSGALLNDVNKEAFAQLRAREASLQAKFSENVLDATNAYTYYATAEELDGVPVEVQSLMRAAAEADDHAEYKITLHFPSYFPVMQYAHDRNLREKLYRAYVTRASELGDATLDNTSNMLELLTVRQCMAELLEFAHYADVSLASKMAESVPQVTGFLYDLAHRAKSFAQADIDAVNEFAQKELGLNDVQAWDLAYVSEKLREVRYVFSEQEIKEYFPLNKVLSGLFYVVEQLFGVQIIPKDTQTWHEDVKFFELLRDGQIIGGVYLDPFARSGKNSGAWMDEVRSRRLVGQSLQTPVAHMVTNFASPLAGQESTLTHDDIITLFHEAGHALHHLLTRIDDFEVAGIHGVEWDAVELPSQFMENFCWDYDNLARMSKHSQTGEQLPRALFNKMLAAKNFQSGLQMLRQVEFSLYDILLHTTFSSYQSDAIHIVLKKIRDEIAVIHPPEFNRFAHSFSHIFAGGYSAGYFSYKWAEVLSADVFSAFELAQKNGDPLLNFELGQRYWYDILSVGGSRPAMESFKAFMGREPQIDALLRHSGLE